MKSVFALSVKNMSVIFVIFNMLTIFGNYYNIRMK